MFVVLGILFVVDILLLFAAGRFLGGSVRPARLVIAALADASLGLFSILPGVSVSHPLLLRLLSLLAAAFLAYGLSFRAIPKTVLFCLLQLSLGGIGTDGRENLPLLLGAAGIGFACLIVGRHRDHVPVQLRYGDRILHLTALHDTGNNLRDPITGSSVLIVDADIAEKLTGLTPAMLREPVQTLEALPGLRLIPYQTVGSTGFLLALWLPDTRIGSRQGGALVAFSPNLLGKSYQALTGGNL